MTVLLSLLTAFAFAKPLSSCQTPLREASFEAIQERVLDCDLREAEQVIAVLPESFMKNYALIYASTGLQGASRDFPRPVLFGEDGSFILSFNGGSDQFHHNTIEMIQYRPESRVFEFREIEFTEGARANISGENPEQCLACHSSDNPRPLWETDMLWPGSFGSEDDGNHRGSQDTQDFVNELRFMTSTKNEGRYRYLADATERGASPNLTLSRHIQRLSFLSLSHRLGEMPAAKPLRYALVGALLCGQTIESFLPEDRFMDFHRLEDLIPETERKLKDGFARKLMRQKKILKGSPETTPIRELEETGKDGLGRDLTAEAATVAAFRMIFEDGLHERLPDYSQELFGSGYSFQCGDSGLPDLADPLIEAFFADDAEFLDRDSARRQGRLPVPDFCSWAAEKSRDAISKGPAKVEPQKRPVSERARPRQFRP